MLCTLLVVGMISHLWCAARLVGIAHHSFYSEAVVTKSRAYLWAEAYDLQTGAPAPKNGLEKKPI